jgi:hypothetical protein
MGTRTPDEHRAFWPAKGKSLEVDWGPHFVVWLKQTSVRAAFHGVSIVSSKLFPSILT